jgi:hypothetical protein
MNYVRTSNTTHDLKLLQLQFGLSTTNFNFETTAALAGMANTNALAGIDLVCLLFSSTGVEEQPIRAEDVSWKACAALASIGESMLTTSH